MMMNTLIHVWKKKESVFTYQALSEFISELISKTIYLVMFINPYNLIFILECPRIPMTSFAIADISFP